MIYRVACLLARIRFTVGYVAALASVSTTILMHGPQVHAQVIRHASTNLHNLAHGHLGTLWNSAFVIDEGPLYFWFASKTNQAMRLRAVNAAASNASTKDHAKLVSGKLNR